MNYHFDDEEKKSKIRLVQAEAEIDKGEGLAKTEVVKPKEITMNKKEAIALQQKVQQISIGQIKKLKTLSESEIYSEIQYLQPMLQDTFFNQTGIEIESLNWHTEQLDLEKDEEYIKILKEYHETVENL